MEPKTKRTRPPEPNKFVLFGRYLRSRYFLLTLLGLFGLAIVSFVLLNLGLGWYTNHGQRLEVANYIDMDIDQATRAIERNDFRVEIIDSVFLIDEEPGTVLRQDPPAGAFVKEGRRIYLTVTKTIPDKVTLPPLAGTYELDRYLRKLALMDLSGTIKDKEYSSRYQPNTILKVFYEGREVSERELRDGYRVPRGSKLEFIVSTSEGGAAEVPDLRCLTLDEARFLLENYRLRVGTVEEDATVADRGSAYVWRQDPAYVSGVSIPFDTEVTLYLTQNRPPTCD